MSLIKNHGYEEINRRPDHDTDYEYESFKRESEYLHWLESGPAFDPSRTLVALPDGTLFDGTF